MKQKELSIITVNYKTPTLLHTCISSIYKHTLDVDFEIIVVDNNSEDESEDLIKNSFPEVKWINSGFNAGTSISYNIGVKASNGQYVLIINSDTELVENTIKITLDYYKELEKEHKVGMIGCRLIGYDNKMQYNSHLNYISIKRFLRANPVLIKLKLFQDKITEKEITELHNKNHLTSWMWITYGLINRDLFTKDNLFFDEDIFMYFDDVEWCYRANKKGYDNYYMGDTTILHYNGGSAAANFSGWRHGQIMISDWLGLIKTYGKFYYIICLLIFRLNLFLDDFFYRINKKKRNKQMKEIRDFEKRIFKKYVLKILLNYKKETSSAKQFLKFEIPK